MAETKTIIELNQVAVRFTQKDQIVDAVQDVSLEIKQGDVYGIIGYSGAGKSTLVRVINLLQRPTAGQVIVNHKNLLQLTPKQLRVERKNIGMIFQHFNLLNSRTVFGNVDFPLMDSKLTSTERQQKVNKLLKLVGLSDKADNYPSQLSGGQKQRVAIARALANDPEILISDEATSALDPETTTEILNLLGYLNQSLGITIVIITHEMDAIKQVCNHVAVMDQGKIVEKGSLLDIFGQPQHALTKKFVDSSTQLGPALKEIKKSQILPANAQNLIELNYLGDVTEEPIVVELYKKFNVEANILFSNIEQLQGTTVGIMLLALNGSATDVQKALAYLNQLNVNVKQINLAEIEAN
ncbi:methionine ABC transporter ATP-binding protein [Bombilactobacillus bombi]|nr:methionine ABC transporter ATP-binding protein [Bombilactobacillus bombi]